MATERDIETEQIQRKRSETGLLVKLGNHKLTVPVTSIIGGALVALGTAYQVVKNDRAEILARLDAQERCAADLSRKLELEQVVLSEIRTQLARIDARVAEVQVTLMRRNP
jgi:hypothetical protein